MKRTVHKYALAMPHDLGAPAQVELPVGAEVLTVATQHNEPRLWALVDPEEVRTEWRKILVLGTGWDALDVAGWCYVSTFQIDGGRLVFHVFQKLGDARREVVK